MKNIYPKITTKNFHSFIKDNVKKGRLEGIKIPSNLKEFKQATKNLYGVELSVSCMAYPLGSFHKYDYSCRYEIEGLSQEGYSKGDIYKLWEKEFSQYKGLKILLSSCFGELFCGGVGAYHYGQTKCDKDTWERVSNWDSKNDKKVLIANKKQDDSLKDIFGFNPFS